MIRTPEGQERGAALFAKYSGAITGMVLGRKKQYFEHQSYKGLKNRCRSMDQYIDNVSPASSTFISDITPQTIRKAYTEYSALFRKFLETDPLFSIDRMSKLPKDQEHLIIEKINDNLKKTGYRERCLQWTVDDIVRYGTAATYSFATDDFNSNSLMTVKSDSGYEGTYDQVYQDKENAVVSTPVHPMNVIMDPRANAMVAPDYVGFIGDICVANIKVLLQNEAYNQKNLMEVFNQCKQGLPDEHWFDGLQKDMRNYTKGHSNITYMWTRLPFEGNEDDPAWYAIEVIGDKIIRIEENVLDSNTIPLALSRIMPRKYQWYGNSPLEDKIAIQNLQYWLLNTTVESTARLMDRIVLYREGSLDVEAINSRHQTGGLVPYKGQEQDLSKLLYSPQFPNNAYRENDWLTQYMRREDQDSSAMPNFNPQSEGGPTNKTLGGAQMMASIGEIKMSLFVDQMTVGQKDVAKHQLVLLRNIEQGDKSALLAPDGQEITFACRVSNVFNYAREGIDSQNRLSQVINFKATKIPQFSAVKLGAFVEDFVRNSIKRENIADYCDVNVLKQLDALEMQAATQKPAAPPQGVPGGAPPAMGGAPAAVMGGPGAPPPVMAPAPPPSAGGPR